MRTALTIAVLMMLSAMLPGAVESFTLDDGRTLVGEYDAEDQRLYTSIDGKATSLLVADWQIVERGPVGAAKPLAPLPTKVAPQAPVAAAERPADAPASMSPEEKAAADAAFARQLKVREADRLEAEAAKADRDAKAARDDAERKRVEAKRHRAAFIKRLEKEPADQPWTPETLLTTMYILPRTAGNNRATVEAWARAGQLEQKATELDALAAKKRAESAAARP